MRREVFRMERVTYREKDVVFLEDLNMHIFEGEVMGLLPINRLGVSEFLHLLVNNGPLYEGYVYYCEEKVNSWRGPGRTTNRVFIIRDKSCLVEGMSVAENVFVLRQGFRQGMIRKGLLKKQLAPFLEDLGVNLSADTYVEHLSPFERVFVELLKAVVTGHKLIVFDEIGTVINDREMHVLYRMIRHYVEEGFSFLFISPHFEELIPICDRTLVMSEGHIQKVIPKEEMKRGSLLECSMEFDRIVRNHLSEKEKKHDEYTPVLEISNLSIGGLKRLNFSVSVGECVVVQNLSETGIRDFQGLFSGQLKPEEGEIRIENRPVNLPTDRRIAVIQELPGESMVFPEMSYMDNLCFTLDKRIPEIWISSGIRRNIRKELREDIGDEVFDIPVKELDERQKLDLVYNRIMLQKPRVVFCIQPFRGADLSHRMFIWKKLEAFLERKIAVVILALNLADTLSLADRLIRIGRNQKVEEYGPADFAGIPVVAPWKHLYMENGDGCEVETFI